jgi:hypothetical protein
VDEDGVADGVYEGSVDGPDDGNDSGGVVDDGHWVDYGGVGGHHGGDHSSGSGYGDGQQARENYLEFL